MHIGGHRHDFLDPAVMVSSDVNPNGTLIAQAGRNGMNLEKVNVGFIGGEVVLLEGDLISAVEATVDAEMAAYLQPFVDELDVYVNSDIGLTNAPIDALQTYTQETNVANLQADVTICELTSNGIPVDFHLSKATSNRLVADGASPTDPVMLIVDKMYILMSYENSLVVLSMNGHASRKFWSAVTAIGGGTTGLPMVWLLALHHLNADYRCRQCDHLYQ